MKTILYNAQVYIDKNQIAQACVIEDGVFTYVGDSEHALLLAEADSLKIDCHQKSVVPGFNDSHLHFYMTAQALSAVDCMGATSIEEVILRGKDFLKKHPTITFLWGRGWNQDYFKDGVVRMVNRNDLDQISKDIPIVFARACGHVVAANSKALELASITIHSKVDGGEIEVVNQQLTGVLSENAVKLLDVLKNSVTVEEILKQLHMVAAVANACGITSVQTNDLNVGTKESELIEQAYQLYAQQHPTVRIYHQICFKDFDSFKQRINQGYKKDTNDFNRYGPLKLFTDGSLGARTAFMRQPYHDDPSTNGIATLTQEQLNQYVSLAHANQIQVAMHAIGDGAIEMVLNSYESVFDGKNLNRHGIIHCQITDMPLLKRFKQLDVLAYLQPIFLHYDMHMVEDRVGKPLASTSYAFNTMSKLGLHIAYGTDAPVEPFDVLNCIHCAVNRTDLNNYPNQGFYPEEKVSMSDAIDYYTIGSAYASFEEDRKGRIQPGFLADCVLLSEDIFAIDPLSIKDVKVEKTIVNGAIVYQKQV